MAVNEGLALDLVKARLNRLHSDTTLDRYLESRIAAVVRNLEKTGIQLEDNDEDLMFVVDMTVWEYQNRDQAGGMPDWLRLKRREKWLRSGVGNNDP